MTSSGGREVTVCQALQVRRDSPVPSRTVGHDSGGEAVTLAEEAQRYLAVVQAIREECDTDFLRFGGSNDTKREIRARLEAYDARRSAFDARAHWLGQT